MRLVSLPLPAALVVIAVASGTACEEESPYDPAPGDLRLSLIVGLRRDDAGLAEAALLRSTPRDPSYRQWLTPDEMADQFGASPDHVEAALAVLEKAGFEGSLDPTGGLLVGQMSAADAGKFFGTTIIQRPYGEAGLLAMPEKTIEIPAALADHATEVVGLVMGMDRDTRTTVPVAAAEPPPDPPCPAALGLALQLRGRYQVKPLLDAGANGQGVRMAMVEVSPTSQKALDLFAACRPVLRVPPVTLTHADASTPEAFLDYAAESTLDVIAAAVLAPGLDGIDIHEVNPFAPVAVGLASVLATARKPEGLPELVSLSLGFCEPHVSDEEIAVSERVLMGLSAMGTSVLASTGDFGSSACAPDSLDEAVQYPASSPWVLGVGGTSLVATNGAITDEVAWSTDGFGGGGGRTSRMPRPSYQFDVPFEGNNRIVPDVAFVANPEDLGPIPICDTGGTCEWRVYGGTSATAPGIAGGMASVLQYVGRDDVDFRVGALNTGVYGIQRNRAAAETAGSYFDIVSGDNDAFGIGCCSATPGYDAATGWGVMDFFDVAQRLDRIVHPAPQP